MWQSDVTDRRSTACHTNTTTPCAAWWCPHVECVLSVSHQLTASAPNSAGAGTDTEDSAADGTAVQEEASAAYAAVGTGAIALLAAAAAMLI